MTVEAGGGPPDREQRELVVRELDRNIMVEAAAGTGKTRSIVERMVALLSSGKCTDARHIAAVTFTRKAAAELKARFRAGLESAERCAGGEEKARLEEALGNIEQCFVGTIHSFCGMLLAERPVEAGVGLEFEEIDDTEDERLRGEAWAEYSARLLAHDPEGVLEELDLLGLSMNDLRDTFGKFADYPDVDDWPRPRVDRPDTEAAARAVERYTGRMKAISSRLPESYGTDRLIPLYRAIPRVISHQEDMREPARLADVLGWFKPKLSKRDVRKGVWTTGGAFTWEDAQLEVETWEEFREGVAEPFLRAWREYRYAPVMRALHCAREVYDAMRAENGLLNFADLLLKAAALLRDRPTVRRYFAARYTHLLVDEFQDTDPVQAEVMLLLTASDPRETDWTRCRPRPGSLFVVGDPKQSIYRFRRADIVTYERAKRIVASPPDGMVVELSANFRATGTLIDWVNSVFEPLEGMEGEGPDMLRFTGRPTDESPGYVRLEKGGRDPDGVELGFPGRLVIGDECSRIDDAVAYEADLIARFIRAALDSRMAMPRTSRQLEDGVSREAAASDFMIVTMKKKNLSIYARALQSYGVEHRVTGGKALNEVEALWLLNLCVRAAARPHDPVALIAALRSELFGVSDACLYRFKKAGGVFSYNADVPPGLTEDDDAAIGEAFAGLRECAGSLARMPAVAAIEKTARDLGLEAYAAAGPGGDVEAGSLAKAVEVLRAARRDTWSSSELVEYLGRLADAREPYDGISALSEEKPVVRVMNLHQVKGLEAPVVFLADPSAAGNYPVEMFVDRSTGRVLGYLAVTRKKGEFVSEVLAQPPGWEELAAAEERFARAEGLRLRYVAATRAGAALFCTQRKRSGGNPWRHFDPYLEGSLEDPGERSAPPREDRDVTAGEIESAFGDIEERLARVEVQGYDVRAAKLYALSGAGAGATTAVEAETPVALEEGPAREGEHGAEWGSVIHLLLQVAMKDAEANLLPVAAAALSEYGMDPGLAGRAAEEAESAMGSELWARARKSERRLVEVPFELLLGGGDPPTVVRGAIDLIFKESDGWVLVDYKSDAVRDTEAARSLAERYAPQVDLYARAWEEITGEKVKEKTIYFTGL